MNLITQYKGLKKEVYIFFVGRLVTAMGSFVWPMMTYILKGLNISDALTTLLIAIATLVSLPATYLGGKMADKFGRKKIIIIFDFITISLYFIAACLPISYAMIALIFVASLAQSLEGPAYDSITADFTYSSQRDNAYSLLYLGFNLGFILGGTISGLLYPKFVFLSFLLNGFSILISTLLIIFFINEKNSVKNDDTQNKKETNIYEEKVEENAKLKDILKDRKVIYLFILLTCLCSIVSNSVGTVLPLQLNSLYGQEQGSTYYGFLSSLNGLVVIIFTPLMTFFMKKKSELPKCLMGMLFFSLGIVLYAFNMYQILPLMFVGMFVYTLGEVTHVIGSNPYLLKRIPNSHRGRISGFVSVFCSFAVFACGLLNSGLLYWTKDNYLFIWIVYGSIGFINTLLYLLCYHKDKVTFMKLYQQEK